MPIQDDGLTDTAYRSYMVRFWQSNPQSGWRASAQCVQTGNTILFGTLERLLVFLQNELGPRDPCAATEGQTLPTEQA